MADRADTSKWPQLFDSVFSKRQAVLDSAFDVVIVEQALDDGSTTNPTSTSGGTGQLTLEFSLPGNDPKSALVKNEMCVLINYPALTGGQAQDVFAIRNVTDGTEQDGTPSFHVTAEARWYDLGTADAIRVTPAVTTTAAALSAILAGSGWTVGTISPAVSGGPTRTFEIDTPSTPLAAIRSLPGVFGGEVVFDSVTKKVSLLSSRGSSTPVALYARGSNISSDSRVIDTSQLTTRLYPLGASGVDITTVNGGIGYLENYSWYDAQLPAWPHVIKAATSTNDTLSDPTLLKAWGQSQLAMLALPRVTYTVTPVLLQSEGVPGLGDTVRVWDKTIGMDTNARVVQRTLNLLEPQSTTLQINTSAFSLASALPTGAPRGTVVPVASLDHLAPKAPTGIAVTGLDTIDGNGSHVEYLTFTWAAVTQNSDGSPLVDLDHYEVQYRIGTNAWISAGNTNALTLQSGPMPPSTTFSMQVRAVDTVNNVSAWTVFNGTTPGVPAPTLGTPSLPVLDVTTFPLTVRAAWDGLIAGGASYPKNFSHIQVHCSTVSGFTPSASTLVDTMRGAGVMPITGRTPGVAYYVKFVAVDTAGFLSAATAQVSAVPTTVQDNQISSLSVGKLIAGALIADIILSANIRTAVSGARLELNATGLQAYNASGTQTVNIGSNGTASFTGTISGSTITGSTVDGATVRATGGGDVSLTSTAHAFQAGPTTSLNIGIDGNEIQARNNGASSYVVINASGGDITLGTSTYAGTNYLAQRTVTYSAAGAAVSTSANTGTFQLGDTANIHTAFDGNTIQTKAGGGTTMSTLQINPYGGSVEINTVGNAGDIYMNNRTIVTNDGNVATLEVDTNYDNNFSLSMFRLYANEEASLTAWNVMASTVANNNTPNTNFRLRADGTGLCDVSWTGGGADFAEMFESSDGSALPFGRAVALDSAGKVRLASGTKKDVIIGVTSAVPTIVGNMPLNWPDQFQKDVYGRPLLDDRGARIVNPAWVPPPDDIDDSVNHYTTRDLRPEWNAIGLLGQVVVDDDGTATPGGYVKVAESGKFTAGKSGYLVINRVDATHIRVLVQPGVNFS